MGLQSKTTKNSGSGQAAVDNGCFGHCRRCGVIHALGTGNAHEHALALMAELAQRQDSHAVKPPSHAHWSDPDTRDARGQMFGVLECRDKSGKVVVLKAFSALLDGQREMPGWVPPLLPTDVHQAVVLPVEHEIKDLTVRLQELPAGSPAHAEVSHQRAERSRQLLETIHRLHRLHNFRGEERDVVDAWTGAGRLPGGVGGCCAPKLLDHAATHGLTPVGLVEFYWGVSSKRREHRSFYPCCAEKCHPILGFMLCGLDDC